MPDSYTKLTYHFTFSTRDRVASLYDNMRPRLHGYVAQVINGKFGFAREVGGIDDHVHILCDLRPVIDVATFLSCVKSLSSGWMHKTFPNLRDTAWQDGYGAFSVSASAVKTVKEYIQEQEYHHRRISFKEEFRLLLQRHGVEFDEQHAL